MASASPRFFGWTKTRAPHFLRQSTRTISRAIVTNNGYQPNLLGSLQNPGKVRCLVLCRKQQVTRHSTMVTGQRPEGSS